jgi:hypothetical protein
VLIEIDMFQLAAETSEVAFLEADRAVQAEVVPRAAGFVRRTTARGAGGDWAVITLWRSEAEADASEELSREHPAQIRFMELVDGSSRRTSRWTTLD